MNKEFLKLINLPLVLLTLILSTPIHAAETDGFRNESEAGVVVTGGNASSETYSFRQLNFYRWENVTNTLKFDGKFLKTSSSSVESARYWMIGFRYERALVERFSLFLGQNLESDIFAGFLQRYNTDFGAKYYFFKDEDFTFFSEAGYRYMIENRFTGQLNQSQLRFYLEATKDWTKTFSTKAGLEYLPNLTISGDYQLNFDLSVSAALSEVFALKAGYAVKYRKIPVSPATQTTDTQFTTAIVAKF